MSLLAMLTKENEVLVAVNYDTHNHSISQRKIEAKSTIRPCIERMF
jgi:hypothetical protein